MSIKTGSKNVAFEGNEKVEIMAEGRVTVFEIDENGEPSKMIITGQDRIKFRTIRPLNTYVVVDEDRHWSLDVKTQPNPFDKSDPIPVEVPEENQQKQTLEDKLKMFVGSMIAERYGEDSKEFDTFEDSMDFDIDEDPDPLSGFEVDEMEPEFPEEKPETTPETKGDPSDPPNPTAVEPEEPQPPEKG